MQIFEVLGTDAYRREMVRANLLEDILPTAESRIESRVGAGHFPREVVVTAMGQGASLARDQNAAAFQACLIGKEQSLQRAGPGFMGSDVQVADRFHRSLKAQVFDCREISALSRAGVDCRLSLRNVTCRETACQFDA